MTVKKTGLGRNLNLLLSNTLAVKQALASQQSRLNYISVECLQSGKYQPRTHINDDTLQELAHSIKQHGIVQPLVVRAVDANHYEIIAGERRWRAAILAGLSEVPVLVNNIADQAAIAIALIENIQREDLNVIEAATAFQRLIDEFGLTHQQVAEAVGKSRTVVTNTLRLINLNDDVKQLLAAQQLEMGHARALLALSGEAQSQAASKVIMQQLSVRETETLVKKLQQPQPLRNQPIDADPDLKHHQTNLSRLLGTNVRIEPHPQGKGKLVISYSDLKHLEQIMERIS